MDFIIVFFRDMIDGWIYYTILVVNTILIFAIIGYLGERKNNDLIKMGINASFPVLDNGTVDLSSGLGNNNTSIPTAIPQVSATTISNPNVVPQGNSVPILQPVSNNVNPTNNAIPQVASNVINFSNPPTNGTVQPVNVTQPNNVINQVPNNGNSSPNGMSNLTPPKQ